MYRPSMQGCSFYFGGCFISIEGVACERTAYGRHMYPDLVGSARFKAKSDQGVASFSHEGFVIGDSGFSLRVYAHLFSVFGGLHQRGSDLSAWRVRYGFSDGEIAFVKNMFFPLAF